MPELGALRGKVDPFRPGVFTGDGNEPVGKT